MYMDPPNFLSLLIDGSIINGFDHPNWNLNIVLLSANSLQLGCTAVTYISKDDGSVSQFDKLQHCQEME